MGLKVINHDQEEVVLEHHELEHLECLQVDHVRFMAERYFEVVNLHFTLLGFPIHP